MTATWTAPTAWAPNDLVTAGDLNTRLNDNLEFLYERPVGDYILIRDEKTQNTGGGTFTSGAWQTRDLNTEVQDDGEHASVASNQITLEAGTYAFRISAPAYKVNSHQVRLQNVTDSTTVALGTVERSANGENVPSRSFVSGVFTIAASKDFEAQHYGTTTVTTTGYGYPGNIDTEVYTVAEFWKVK